MKTFTLLTFSVLVFLIPSCQWNLESLAPNNDNFQCGDMWIDNRDDQAYTTIQIGTQCWFAENINIGTRINASIDQTNNNIIEKYCYDDSEGNCTIRGGLYKFEEAFQGVAIDSLTGNVKVPDDNFFVKGICPEGWHIPSDKEWKALEASLRIPEDSLDNVGFRGEEVFAGNKLKSLDEGNCATPPTNCGDSGFEALLGGFTSSGVPTYLGVRGVWWSSTPLVINEDDRFYHRMIEKSELGISRGWGTESLAISVRCIKSP